MSRLQWCILLVGLAAFSGCRQEPGSPQAERAPELSAGQEGTTSAVASIEKVLERHTEELMALPGVVGVYQGLTDAGRPCIRVMVVELTPDLERGIPKQLEGHPVEIEAGGPIRPLGGD